MLVFRLLAFNEHPRFRSVNSINKLHQFIIAVGFNFDFQISYYRRLKFALSFQEYIVLYLKGKGVFLGRSLGQSPIYKTAV